MIFTSQIFLFWFLPLVLLVYYALPFRARSGFLALASYLFYAWWRLDFVALMLFSTVIDFSCGKRIAGYNALLDQDPEGEERGRFEKRRKRYLLASIFMNLGLLAYFKYWNFGIDSMNALLGSMGHSGVSWTEIVLPVGISFYTFQSLSYSIDVYRRDAPAARSFLDFACYISLFPQLVAGPIVRYRTLAAELVIRTHTLEKIATGAFLFQVGFAKKLLLADSFAVVADEAFGLADPTMYQAWLGTLAYTFQIYFDFSGYSDMAIGLGALFGFPFPINFNSPYKSQNITEFWQRWHISLSTWLRDYLYIPLGGNKKGPRRTYINLMLTMLLGGLWHGAAFTFILWGLFQGSWLALERMFGRRPFYGALPKPLRIACTFVLVMLGWVLFRSENMEQLGTVYSALVGMGAEQAVAPIILSLEQMIIFGVGAFAIWFLPNSQQLVHAKWGWPRLIAAGAFAWAVCQMFVVTYSPFLYFQF